MPKKLHFALFGVGGPEQWDRDAGNLYDWNNPDLLIDVARMAERAKIDLMLFADGPGMPSTYRGNLQYAAETGTGVAWDSLITMAALSTATKHIGLGSTQSTTFTPPYLMARQFSSLDHISGGRAAWNVVTSTHKPIGELFNFALPEHDERYEMADEHLKICRALWDSWAPDAVIQNLKDRVWADYQKITPVDFQGKYYSCRGPLNVPSSPQRRPLIIMAGASARGKRFAVENADMVIAHNNTVSDMKVYSTDLRKQLVAAGRDPYSCKIFFAIRPWIGQSEQEAKEKMEANAERAKLEHGLGYLSMNLGYDLSKFDLEMPLRKDMKVDAIIGTLMKFTQALEGITLREAALTEARRENFPMYGTPEQVADIIEATAQESDADGFHFRYAIQDYPYVVQIATQLIPILQKRGLFRTEYTGKTLRENMFGSQ